MRTLGACYGRESALDPTGKGREGGVPFGFEVPRDSVPERQVWVEVYCIEEERRTEEGEVGGECFREDEGV